MVNIQAAQYGLVLWSADAGRAFRKEATSATIAEMSGQPLRRMQFELPENGIPPPRKLPGLEDCSPLLEVLEMVRPGFVLKEAPRA